MLYKIDCEQSACGDIFCRNYTDGVYTTLYTTADTLKEAIEYAKNKGRWDCKHEEIRVTRAR